MASEAAMKAALDINELFGTSPVSASEIADVIDSEFADLRELIEHRDRTVRSQDVRNRELERAIREHRDQKADDRCIEDDDRLYAALGDGIKCDRHVGNRAEMLLNCARFIDQRCEGGVWPSYRELETDRDALAAEVAALRPDAERWRHVTGPLRTLDAATDADMAEKNKR